MPTYPPSPDLSGGGPAPEQSTSVLTSDIYSEYANSYCSLDYAASYFSNHYKASYQVQWAALSEAQQSQLLIQATYDIERYKFVARQAVPLYHWFVDPIAGRILVMAPTREPIKYNYFQALQFPRNIDYKADGTIFIPPAVQMAQCEQAIYRLNLDETFLANRMQGMTVNNVKAGNVSVYQHFDSDGTNLAPTAKVYLLPYMKFTKRMVRS